jgi:GAF domain
MAEVDAPEVEVALLDSAGVIVDVNQAWHDFCLDNGGDLSRTGIGMSYLDMCAAAADDAAIETRAAIETALLGELSAPLTVQIPCDAPDQPRWFDVLVSSRFDLDGRCIGATVTLSLSRSSRRPISDGRDRQLDLDVPFPDVPRAEMEQLVAELSQRVHDVVNAQARLRVLLRAGELIVAEPSLAIVLAQIVQQSRDLIQAEHAALRRADESFEPPASSHLAVPIRVRGDLYATLTLTDSNNGEFSAEDQWLANAFAVTAGVAIDKALLHADIAGRQRWQRATVDACAELAGAADGDVLDIVVRHAAIGAAGDRGFILDRGEALLEPVLMAVPLPSDRGRALAVSRPETGVPFEPADLDQLAAFVDVLAISLARHTD